MKTELPVPLWQELIASALAFEKLSPWEWVLEAQVFGVQMPDGGEKMYCSVMGNAGEMKALAIYPGKQGWRCFMQLGNDGAGMDASELAYHQRCIIVSFDQGRGADLDEVALMRRAGFEVGEESVVPSFRSYQPGYVPTSPGREEIAWLRAVLDQAFVLLVELPGGTDGLPESGLNGADELLFRTHSMEHGWQTQWLKADTALDFSPPTAQLTPSQVQQGHQLPLQEAVWLMEDFHLPQDAVLEEGRAFFPRAMVLFDLEGQRFRGVALLQPRDFPDQVTTALLDLLEEQACRPSHMVVSRRSNLVLMRPFCQALGIGIHLDESLDILPALREALMDVMSAGRQ